MTQGYQYSGQQQIDLLRLPRGLSKKGKKMWERGKIYNIANEYEFYLWWKRIDDIMEERHD